MGKKKGKDKVISKSIEESVPVEVADGVPESDDKADVIEASSQEKIPQAEKSVVIIENDENINKSKADIAAKSSSKNLQKAKSSSTHQALKSASKGSQVGEEEKQKSAENLEQSSSQKLVGKEAEEDAGKSPKTDDKKKTKKGKKGGKKSKKAEDGATVTDDGEDKPKPKKKKKSKKSISEDEGDEDAPPEETADVVEKPPKKKKSKKSSKKGTKKSKATAGEKPPKKKKKDKKKSKLKGEAKSETTDLTVGEEGDEFAVSAEPKLEKKKKKGGKKSSKGSKKGKKKHKAGGGGSSSDVKKKRSKIIKYNISEFKTGSSSSSSSSSETEKELHPELSLSAEHAKIGKKKKGKKGGKKGKKRGKSTSGDESEGETPKKKKKKEKGKKKKKKLDDSQKDEEKEEEVDDIMAEINRMKAQAAAQALGEEIDETASTATTATKKSKKKKKKKKKKGPKKKLSKKEKAKLAAEMAEKNRIEAEQQAARKAEEERIRLEEERKAAIEKEKREIVEQQVRMEQLEAASDFIRRVLDYNRMLDEQDRTQRDWENYLACGRLPDPSKCDLMNPYLHIWDKVMEETTIEEASKRTADVIQILDELDSMIDTPNQEDLMSNSLDNWKWVRQLFRQHQWRSLDVATYRLLRNVEKNLNRIDIPTANFQQRDDHVILCVWLRVQLPTPLPNPRKPPKPRIEIDLPAMNMTVQFPMSVDCDKMAIRTMYLKYDHLSDLCETFEKPVIPAQYQVELFEFMRQEWREKLLYKYENRVIPPPRPKASDDYDFPDENRGEQEEVAEEPTENILGPDDEIPFVPYRKLEPTASEFVIGKEDTMYMDLRHSLMKNVTDEDVINLRKYTVIGGVYVLNLLKQPPQPQDFVTMELNLTPLYLPKQLEVEEFFVEYVPPVPAEPGVRRLPEEIEEELRKQEEELDKLMLVTLTWPEHVIFLELPLVCHWDFERNHWTRQQVHDLKHNEEKGQLTFRTGQFGVFALAAYRYANLPFQAWEIRPEADGTVTLQITAAILLVEFSVNAVGQVALATLQNSTNNALQDIVGVFMKLPKLMRVDSAKCRRRCVSRLGRVLLRRGYLRETLADRTSLVL